MAACEPVLWHLAEVLSEPGARVQHAYFPVTGFLSLVTEVGNCPRLEVGMVGREGVLGAELSLGVLQSPFHVLVQGAGAALRIKRDALATEMLRSDALRLALKRYTGVTLAQLATSAACLRLHRPRARLARWLLMTQDRAQSHQFPVTHTFLAYMLGETQKGVADALATLELRQLIEHQHDTITVIDRPGLEATTCSCYRAEHQQYEHQLGL